MKDLEGHVVLNTLTSIGITITLILSLFYWRDITQFTLMDAFIWMNFWLVLALVSSLFLNTAFVPAFLTTTLCMMIGWRIAGIYQIACITYPLLAVFFLFLTNFLHCARLNLQNPGAYREAVSLEEWRLTFVRLYLGLNFIPHFTEKLFSGTMPRLNDIHAFIKLMIPHPAMIVWLAGMCEFMAAIALALGFILRFGAICAVIYLLIATYMGDHFSLGFIWAGIGGGWEFPVMWSALIFSFVLPGKHKFSLDQWLKEKRRTSVNE